MRSAVCLRTIDDTGGGISDDVILCVYNNLKELLVANLAYAYLHESSEGTVFSEDGGVLIGKKKFETVLAEYRNDLRYDGLLQFVAYAFSAGIDADWVEGILQETTIQLFKLWGECKEFIDNHQYDYVYSAVYVPEALDDAANCVTHLGPVEQFIYSCYSVEETGDLIFGHAVFSALRGYLQTACIGTYDQFCDIVAILQEACGAVDTASDFRNAVELSLVSRLLRMHVESSDINGISFAQLLIKALA